MRRRSFLQHLFVTLPALILGLEKRGFAARGVPPGRRVPLMQGMTSNSATQIVVLTPADERWTYVAVDEDGVSLNLTARDRMRGVNSRYATERLIITGLRLERRYTLQIYGAANQLIDTRHFRALDLGKTRVRFAFMSCMDDRSSVHRPMWAEVLRQKPELLFFIGDNVYVDSDDIENSPGYIWNRYVETRLALDIFQIDELIPTITTWDDHDYGVDDGNRTFAFKDDVLQIYRAFFGSVDAEGFANGPGVSNVLHAFGQRFVLFDDRTWRDLVDLRAVAPGGRQWGESQLNWVFSQLDPRSTAPLWLFNGSMYYGAYHPFESVEREAPEEFRDLRERLKAFAAPTVLASGDVHYAEISRIEPSQFGYPTIELTTSAIHCTPADSISRNPRRVFAGARNNFMVVEASADGASVEIKVSVHGLNQAVYHAGTYAVSRSSR